MGIVCIVVERLLKFFAPDDFGGNLYSFMTNQISHCAISFVACYLIGGWYFVASFWLVWEIYQLNKSKNLQDFIFDLTFELSGVLIFIYLKPALICVILLFLFVLIFKK